MLSLNKAVACFEVEVFKDSDGERPIGVWGRRTLARRASISVDQALMRDLTAALVNAGAEDLSERP